MDYIAKQAIKSKAGALTGTIDNLSKDVSDKCKKVSTSLLKDTRRTYLSYIDRLQFILRE